MSTNWNSIPQELRALPQWCLADDMKAPRQTSGAYASSTDPSTWTAFEAACAEAAARGWHIGFVLTANDPYSVIDLDVKDDTTQDRLELYKRIVENVNSYTEGSRSGKGAHIWVRGNIGAGCKRDGVEVYSQERFIICTGNVWHNNPIEERQTVLTNMVAMMRSDEVLQPDVEDEPAVEADTDVIARAQRAANADKFNALCKGEWKALGYPSQSEADMAWFGITCLYSKNNEQVRRIFRMTELGKREKAVKDNRYLDRTIALVRKRIAAAAQAAEACAQSPAVQLMLETIKQNEAAKAEAEDAKWSGTAAPKMSLDEMREQLVLVGEGSYVAFYNEPHKALPYESMRKYMRRNTTLIEDAKGRKKPHDTLDLWLGSGRRHSAHVFGFDPNEGKIYSNSLDHDKQALNLWVPLPRMPSLAPVCRALSHAFFEHVQYLVPVREEREWFLDWCAHMAQRPGELPQHHWLFWTPETGIGRNTLAKILARVFAGYVAQNFQLSLFLKNGFNGNLSRRLLVYVDEVKEGITRRHEDTFKEMVTTAVRHINPKTLPERYEKNCARWLMFSNHEYAIPLGANDRRFNVVRNPDERQSAAYYTTLNMMADDEDFIMCVREALHARDISKYNPGATAIMNQAKRTIIAASASPPYQRMMELIETHSADLIQSYHLFFELFERYPQPGTIDGKAWTELRSIAKEHKAEKLPDFVRDGQRYSVWAIRNAHAWRDANPTQILQGLPH